MKRLLLLLLAAVLPAAADDLETKRAEAAKLIGRAWELRGKGDAEAKDVAAKTAAAIRELYPRLENPAGLVFRFPNSASVPDRKQSLEVVQKRLAAWGAKDARVVSHDGTTVYVLLNESDEKSIHDEERRTLGWGGMVEFRLEATEDNLKEFEKTGTAPKGTVATKMRGKDETFLAFGEVELDSKGVASIAAGKDPDGRPVILVTLNQAGAVAMERITTENPRRRLAIIFGGEVLMAPTIVGKIGGNLQIVGNFEQAWLDRLVATFSAGMLLCPLEEIGCSSQGDAARSGWAAEPADKFVDRMLANNLTHAILEEVLRGRQPEAYAKVLEALVAPGENH